MKYAKQEKDTFRKYIYILLEYSFPLLLFPLVD